MNLRQQLEARRDSIGHKVLADHANGTPYCPDFFTAGADAMLELLWPCVEALETTLLLYDKRDVEHTHHNIGELAKTLTALRERLETK